MSKSILLKYFILSGVFISVNSDILDLDPKYFNENPVCFKLNQTFYSYIDKILKKLNQTADPNTKGSSSTSHHIIGAGINPETHNNHRKSEEKITKFYNFTIVPPDNPFQPVHIFGYFRVNAEDNFSTSPFFNYIIGDSPLVKFLPLHYQIQVITIEGSELPFTLILGKRCKWMCEKASKKCSERVCWEKPSFCRGPHEDCLKLDGNGVCFDMVETGFPTGHFNTIWKSNETHTVFTTIDIGKYAQYHGQDNLFISGDGTVQDLLKYAIHWVCKEDSPGSEHIFCEGDWMHVGITTRLLKTIAG